MDFEHFKHAVASHFDVDLDSAMDELSRSDIESELWLELMETGSVSIELGTRKFVLSIQVEEEL